VAGARRSAAAASPGVRRRRPAGRQRAAERQARIRRWKLVAGVGAGVVYVAGWGIAYLVDLRNPAPVQVSVPHVELAAPRTPGKVDAALLPQVAVTGASWSLAAADAREVVVQRGAVTLELPYPRSACRRIAHLLGSTCRGRAVGVAGLLDLAWPKRQQVLVSSSPGDAVFTFPSRGQLGVQTQHAGVRICITPQSSDAGPTLTSTRGTVSLPSADAQVSCPPGGVALRTTGGGASFALDGVDGELDARGRAVRLRGIASGSLEAVGTSSFGARDVVRLTGAPRAEADVMLDADGRASLEVPESRMASVEVNGQQLLPTNLSRNRDIVLALLPALFSLVLAAPRAGESLAKRRLQRAS
jgi:hypothetical protein